MNAPPTTQRFHNLDALRAFAMLLGILLHAMMSFITMPVNISVAQDVQQNTPVYTYLLHAIHGFRMPLFFLVSGFFTVMMWRKRGLQGLAKHRLWRIGVPLLIGIFTLVPMVIAMGIVWNANVWFASAKGNTRYVSHYLQAGGDPDARMQAEGIPGHGGTALHIAAFSEQNPVIELLLAGGADINAAAYNKAGDRPSLETPLHWVAMSNKPTMVKLLLDSGADVNRRDAFGKTALDKVVDLSDTHGDVIQLLKSADGRLGSELPDQSDVPEDIDWNQDLFGSWAQAQTGIVGLFVLFCFVPPLAHLWFLWYLLWLVAAFVLAVKVLGRSSFFQASNQDASAFKVLFWLFVCTLVPQLLMVQSFGADTASGLIPWPPTLCYYAVFFFFGAYSFERYDLLRRFARKWRVWLIIAMAILPLGAYAVHARVENFVVYQAIAAIVATIYAWLMIFGLMGVFEHYCSNENHRVRYVSDSAYWLYLMHLPLVYALQIWMSDWLIPSYIKLTLICCITGGLLMATYHLFVRYTWIGTLLNGKKHRPGSQASA